ncbi:MAG: MBOAT family protein [Oligoflexia bacterium]|nr:MBOAT family protein [Oligoflexia bacterium]MBF0364067.1 MBOAT family protein [Oligoflexia bacterium]
MLFNSFSFLVYFPIVTTLYFLLPHRLRWQMLLLSSCIFYMWFIPKYILVLALTIVIDYFAGILIESAPAKSKKVYLIVSIVSTCMVLFAFKYFNFFTANFALLADFFGLNYPAYTLEIILPIGLSFHTFQSLSYVIEVYRGNQRAEHHFGIYALYVMFYPQLVAGPIERPQNLLHQFYEKHTFDYARISSGLKLMAFGMFKKVVIADRLAILVNQVYDNPTAYNGLGLIIATLFFAFQIYCDFSGYSDIAIGAAEVMGFKLMKNFDRPYFAKSISEFWKRWHISLSTWFKDYLYISLGGNRCGGLRMYFNLFLTFLVSGLWHGASWNYVIWGALNGFYLVFALATVSPREKICKLLQMHRYPLLLKTWQISITFALIAFSWIFFRAPDLATALYIVQHLFNVSELSNLLFSSAQFNQITLFGNYTGMSGRELLSAMLLLMLLTAIHLRQRHHTIREELSLRPFYIRWPLYYALVMSIIFWGVYGENQFIYFQF